MKIIKVTVELEANQKDHEAGRTGFILYRREDKSWDTITDVAFPPYALKLAMDFQEIIARFNGTQ